MMNMSWSGTPAEFNSFSNRGMKTWLLAIRVGSFTRKQTVWPGFTISRKAWTEWFADRFLDLRRGILEGG